MQETLRVSMFGHKRDNQPKNRSLSWEELAEKLTRHTRRRRKDGPLWSPACYRPDATRGKAGVESVCCVVLDFDDGTRPENLTPGWERWEYVIHTTYQNTPEAPRWRAVFPLRERVLAAAWPEVHARLTLGLGGGHTDESCKDASRLYYLPACEPGAVPFTLRHEGERLDPGAFPELAPAGPERAREEASGPSAPWGAIRPEKALEQALERSAAGRDNAGFWLACRLRDAGMSRLEADPVMLAYAARVSQRDASGKPERYTSHDARRNLESAFKGGVTPGNPPMRRRSRGRATIQDRLLAMASGCAELFHDPSGQAFATVEVEGRRETWPVPSKSFAAWLAFSYYSAEQRHVGRSAMDEVQDALAAIARFKGERRPVWLRLGRPSPHERNAFYLDLSDLDRRVVRIDASGWEVLSDYPVKFRRHGFQEALPEPERGGSLEEMRPFVNVASGDDWLLLQAWILTAFHPGIEYPVLGLHGEQGSAKSTTARVIRDLVDPSVSPLRALPSDRRDLAVSAKHNWLLVFDNLSGLSGDASDRLCVLSTGGGYSVRRNYTDDEESIFDARRPMILTGIGELASREDLLDRSLLLTLPAIPDDRRTTEAELWDRFRECRGRILGALLDAVVAGLRGWDAVSMQRTPRMAGFARWATALEPALGVEPGAFMDAYERKRGESAEVALEASAIAPYLRQIAAEAWIDPLTGREDGGFEGTASALQSRLFEIARDEDRRRRDWPKGPKQVSEAVQRLAPALRNTGIVVERWRQGGSGSRMFRIARRRPV